jgi:hypothetical protein
MIICSCGRRYTELGQGPPQNCTKCGQPLSGKKMPLILRKCRFGFTITLR